MLEVLLFDDRQVLVWWDRGLVGGEKGGKLGWGGDGVLDGGDELLGKEGG